MKVGVRLVLIIIPAALVLLFFELKLPLVPSSYNLKKAYFEKKLNTIEVLVLGSSQSIWGINPSYFSHTTFNIADINQDLYYDATITKKYLARLTNLQVVIIPISYITLGYQLQQTNEQWREYFYAKVWKTEPLNKKFNIKRYSWYFLYNNTTSLFFARTHFKKGFNRNMDENGFQKMYFDMPPKNAEQEAKDAIKLHNNLILYANYSENIGYISDMITKLQERNIKIIIVKLPLTNQYRKNTNWFINWYNNKCITNLAHNYNCTVLNYTSDTIYTQKDFLDSYHLNYKGAEKLSKHINTEINKIISVK